MIVNVLEKMKSVQRGKSRMRIRDLDKVDQIYKCSIVEDVNMLDPSVHCWKCEGARRDVIGGSANENK